MSDTKTEIDSGVTFAVYMFPPREGTDYKKRCRFISYQDDKISDIWESQSRFDDDRTAMLSAMSNWLGFSLVKDVDCPKCGEEEAGSWDHDEQRYECWECQHTWNTRPEDTRVVELEGKLKAMHFGIGQMIDRAVSRVCDLEPDDVEHEETIRINVNTLIEILEDEREALTTEGEG